MKAILTRFGVAFAILALCLGVTSSVFAQATPESSPASPMGGMDMSGASHPAHIHNGTCAQLGEVVAPLSNVSTEALNNGTPMAGGSGSVGSAEAIPVQSSVTTIDMSMDDLLGGEFALNVHESAENIGNYVSCGNVGGTKIGDTDLLFGMSELNGSGLNGVASLHDNGDGTTTVYVYLTQSGSGMATPMASPVS